MRCAVGKTARAIFSTMLVLSLFVTGISCGQKAQPTPTKSSAAGPTPTPAAVAPTYKWAVGHIWSTEHPAHKALLLFAEMVQYRTAGRVRIEIQPAGALGGDTQLMSAVSKGDLILAYAHTYGIDPKLVFYDMPYLAKDWDEVDKLWHGEDAPVRNVVDKVLRTHDIMIIGKQGFDNDFRGFTNNKRPIRKPEDIAGLKVRMSQVETYTVPFSQGFKAQPVWITLPELYSALQLGTVDAQENGIIASYANRFLEVQKYYTDLRHVYSAGYIIANVPQWNALPEDIKAAVTKSAEEAGLYERTLSRSQRADYLRLAKEKYGVEVTELSAAEWDAFRTIYVKYAYPEVQKLGGDLFDSFKSDAERRLGRKIM